MKKFLTLFIIILFSIYAGEKQVIISKINGGLENNNNYILTGITLSNVIKGVTGDDLDLVLHHQYKEGYDFLYTGSSYSYPYDSKENFIIFPIDYNASFSLLNGNFQLSSDEITEDGDPYKKIIIDNDFKFPASNLSLIEESIDIGNYFSYSENIDIINSHFLAYKNQEIMIRLSYEGKDNDFDPYNKTNPIKLAMNNEKEFLNKSSDYIDFIFNGDDYGTLHSIETDYGIRINFVPGSIYVSGLPNGSYTLQMYSFRYSKELTNSGYVISTLEDEIDFKATDMNINNKIQLLGYYEGNHPQINAKTILISSSTKAALSVYEIYDNQAEIVKPSITFEPFEGNYYIDSTTTIITTIGGLIISPDIDSNPNTNHYLIEANIEYNSNFEKKDDKKREVSIVYETERVKFDYYVKWNTLPPVTNYPHQTVIGFFNPAKDFGTDNYELKDKLINKYIYGYRNIKYINGSNIENIIRGNYTNNFELTFDDQTYLWTGSSGIQNSIMINKVTSDSKGEFYRTNTDVQSYLTFYTLDNLQNFTYEEESETEKTDKATFLWQDSPKSSYGEIIADTLLIFRINKIDSLTGGLISKNYIVNGENYNKDLPEYYLDLYKNTYPIGDTDENSAIEKFVNSEIDYLDLVFDKGEDKEIEAANAIFNFSKENALRVTGLPRGIYMIQLYTVKNSDLLTQKNPEVNYMTFNYEGYKTFEIGLPTLVTGDFASKNNLFMIDNINVYSNYDINTGKPVKNIQVNFVTKVQESILVQMENLIAENMEENGGNHSMPGYNVAEWHELDELLPITSKSTLAKSSKGDFQFPLDIIFLVDDSGSMQNEIDSTKQGLTSFTKELEERGFDVKFNLITFGPDQNRKTWIYNNRWIYTAPVGNWIDKIHQYYDYGYLAIYKPEWFANVDELVDAFDELYATGGYYRGQENGGPAIKWGADYLKNNGRYLNYSNEIVSHNEFREGYIPSKKWLIFLTDENMDDDELDVLPGINGYNQFISQTTAIIKEESISLTGIYHINRGERDELGNAGNNPSDTGDRSYNIFEGYLGDLFTRYEMGGSGENVAAALKNSINTVGIIQRWTLNYESPFNNSDGYKRQVIFSLDGFKDINGNNIEILPLIRDENKDRYYRVSEEKLEAYFTKPDPIEKILYEKDEKILVQVHARSQYNKINDDESTSLVNYRIENGHFELYNEEGTLVLSSESNEIDIIPIANGWYELTAEIDRETYYSHLGKGPVNIKATVSTKENGKTILISSVKIIEIDPPIITSISLSNDTLFNLLIELKDENGIRIYTDSEAFEMSNVQIQNKDGLDTSQVSNYFELNKLNIKLGDIISYIIEVEDNSVTTLNNSQVRIAGKVANINKSTLNLIYSGSGLIDSTSPFISIMIEDDVGNKSELNNENGEIANINVLNYPQNINKTTFNNLNNEDPTYFNALFTMSPQNDKAKLNAIYESTDILVYLVRFDYFNNFSDGFAYSNVPLPLNNYNNIINNSYWAASTDPDFLFSDGKYIFKDILVLNKAGGITGYSENTLTEILSKATNELAIENKEFYVDTVAPRINSIHTTKTYDSSGILITDQDPEIKNLDEVQFNIAINEFNYLETILNTNTLKVSLLNSNFDNLTEIANEKYRIIYNSTNTQEDWNMEFEVFDEAGNSTTKSYNMLYNTLIPKQLVTEAIITDPVTGNKFTNLLDYTLNEIGTGEDIAYSNVYVVSNDFKSINSLPVNISYFDTQPVFENMNNNLLITTYTQSGTPSLTNSDQIVVDTDINGGIIPEAIATSTNGSNYSIDIDFSQIEELVGLYGFKIITPNVTATGGNKDTNGYYLLTGSKYSIIRTTSTYNENYKLNFVYLGQKNISLTVELKDRLNNTKEFTFLVNIKYVLQLKGKTSDSDRERNSVIEIGDGIDIKGITND